jgi:D-alanine-D-alanine ligase
VKISVAVVYGGRSGEHEVSLRSARAVIDALDPSRYVVEEFCIGKDGKWHPRPIVPEPAANPGIDVVFPVLHGTFGEDGTVQGLFELADLPYVGGGVFASAAAMDKEHTKRLLRDRGIPVVDWVTLNSAALDEAHVLKHFELPVFVKPANLGSSVGISKAHNREELSEALREAARYDHKVLVEPAIAGRELECAVLGNSHPEAALPCEILPSREFYDYEDKYLLDQARTVLPAELAPQQTAEIQRLSISAFQAVECSGMARVDFFLEHGSGRLYVNEINTIPGFTSISMYPKMWAHMGMGFPALVDRLIDLALERHAARRALRYER